MRFTKDGLRFRNKCGCYENIEGCKCLWLWSLCFSGIFETGGRKVDVWGGVVWFWICGKVLFGCVMVLICLTLLTLIRSVF